VEPSRDIERLIEVMAALRNPDGGCPWDLKQSFATIAPYTIEEAYEVADAIERNDLDDLRDELGDLLLQVVYHARLAEEVGAFAFGDVIEAVTAKMIRRHPHVFGDKAADDAEAVLESWEAIKAAERQEKTPDGARARMLDDVPHALPALTRAEKLQKRAAKVGFDWPDRAGVLAKIKEEITELEAELDQTEPSDAHIEEEVGDLLFSVVNLARHLKIDPENALRRCNVKFQRRFNTVEESLESEGARLADVGLDRMEAAWAAAKAREHNEKSS
jgi:MazG family protein